MTCKNLLCEGPKSYVLQGFAILRTENLSFARICYIMNRKAKFCKKFAILRTEKLSFARICYVKDRKAMLCKNLLCEGQKSNDLQEFAM